MQRGSEAADALFSLSCASLDYSEWVSVGIAFKDAGGNVSDWLEWCSIDATRYDEKSARQVFDNPTSGYTNNGSLPTTKNTLYRMAYDNGWKPGSEYSKPYIAPSRPARLELSREQQAIRQLEEFFEPGDTVCIVKSNGKNDAGRWKLTRGKFYRAGDLIESLTHEPFEKVFGQYETEAGLWICQNPLDSKDRHDSHVASYRNALVESDELPAPEQYRMIMDSGLPISTVLDTAGKSIHATVRVDADGPNHYRERVASMYEILDSAGFKVDRANSNPARLTRLAGAIRGEKTQRLLHTNIGEPDLGIWLQKSRQKKPSNVDIGLLPPIEHLDIVEEPTLTPVLIDGVLRRGHKMIISGASKSNKSWMAIQLALAIGMGDSWLGFGCERGRVLYLNCEIDKNSFRKRMRDVAMRKGYDLAECGEWVDVLNMRGYCRPLGELKSAISARMEGGQYSALIIDPLYKVNGGDENKAQDVAELVRAMDEICNASGAALVYVHHHSKGAQGEKSALDRGSGSGVFGRDVDASFDVIQLDTSEIVTEHNETGWRITPTLREFRAIEPFNVFFDWPAHLMDTAGDLDGCKVLTPEVKGGQTRGKQQADVKEKNIARLEETFDELAKIVDEKPSISFVEMADMMGCSTRSIDNWVTDSNRLRKVQLNHKNYVEYI